LDFLGTFRDAPNKGSQLEFSFPNYPSMLVGYYVVVQVSQGGTIFFN
jgi:hypothetical protein